MKLCLLFRFIDQYYVFVVHSTITSKVGNRSPKCKKENIENEMKHENLSGEISSPDENKTETSFSTSTLPSSSSREDESTAVQSQTGSTFYIPFCASVFYVMTASGFVCMFAMRVSLSVALMAMVNQTAVTDDVVTINITNISNTDQCPRDPALQRADGEFTWDRHQQGALLAAFSYGILITQVYGAKIKSRNTSNAMQYRHGYCLVFGNPPGALEAHVGLYPYNDHVRASFWLSRSRGYPTSFA